MTITLFSIEIIFRLVMKMTIIEWSLLRVFISVSIISLLVSLIIYKTRRVPTKIITFILCLIASIYALLQAGFENYIGVFMSFGTSSQAGAVKDYIKDYIDSFHWYYWLILIPILLLFIYLVFIEPRLYKKKDKEELSINIITKKQSLNAQLIALTSLILLVGLFYFTLISNKMQNNIQLQSNTSLFINPSMPNIVVDQFGVTTFGLLDIKSTLSPVEEEIIEYNVNQKEIKEETDYTRKIDDTRWLKVTEEETNRQYKNLNNYYLSRKITDKNKYTGELEDKNLIVIMMESANNIAIDEKYYPNLSKIYNEGWT